VGRVYDTVLVEMPCLAPPTTAMATHPSIHVYMRTYMAPSLTYIAQHVAAACNMLALQASHRRPSNAHNVLRNSQSGGRWCTEESRVIFVAA